MISNATAADEVENVIPVAMDQVPLSPHNVEQNITIRQRDEYEAVNNQTNDFQAEFQMEIHSMNVFREVLYACKLLNTWLFNIQNKLYHYISKVTSKCQEFRSLILVFELPLWKTAFLVPQWVSTDLIVYPPVCFYTKNEKLKMAGGTLGEREV